MNDDINSEQIYLQNKVHIEQYICFEFTDIINLLKYIYIIYM